MKQTIVIFTTALILAANATIAQTTFKETKVGHVFYISLPDYMSKTTGLNSAAEVQFKNAVKDIAGFIIVDNKEELRLAEMSFASLSEFYENFIKDFAKDVERRKVTKAQSKKTGETNFIQSDLTYYDSDSKMELYFFVGIAETSTAYYKLICYGSIDSKDKYKADFEKILYSLRD